MKSLVVKLNKYPFSIAFVAINYFFCFNWIYAYFNAIPKVGGLAFGEGLGMILFLLIFYCALLIIVFFANAVFRRNDTNFYLRLSFAAALPTLLMVVIRNLTK